MGTRTLVVGLLVGVSLACVSTRKTEVVPGPSSEAMALVARAQERLANGAITEALQLLRRAVELDPTSDELAEAYAVALVAAGANDEAEAQLRRAKALTPDAAGLLGTLLLQHADDQAAVEEAVRQLEAAVAAQPDNLGARYNLAQAHLTLRHGEAALAALQPLLAARPSDPKLLLTAGKALRQAGRREEAVDYFRRAADFPPTAVEATLELVEALAATGNVREAADTLEAFLENHGATLEGLTRLASLRLRAGDVAGAIAVADDVLSRDENFTEALWVRAIAAAEEDDLDGAERWLRRLYAAEPDVAEAGLGLADVLRRQRKFDEARRLLDELWEKQGAKARDDLRPRIVDQLATLELARRRPEAARPWLEKLPAEPLGTRTLNLWVRYFRLREAYAEGLAWLAAHPANDPLTVTEHRLHMADFLLASGEEERAREVLEPLLGGEEDEVLAGISVLQERKRHSEAVAAAQEARERFPDSTAIRFELAASLERSGAWDEAVTEFRSLIAADPTHAMALNYLGYMFADRGEHLDEAQELLAEAVCLAPRSGAIQDSIGWLYFRLGDLGRAEDHLLEALRLEPEDPTIHEHLGHLQQALGNAAYAAAAYRRALELGPEEAGQRERIEAALAELDGAPTP